MARRVLAFSKLEMHGGQLTGSAHLDGPSDPRSPVDGRLVLYPQGLPDDVALQESCAELVKYAGGNLCCTIDGRADSMEAFVAHAVRLKALEVAGVIVVLTRTAPLAPAVLGTRRRIEHAVPMLERAAWLVFVDPAADPGFFPAAQRLGDLDDEVERAPIWSGPEGMRFLLISPRVRHPRRMSLRIRELDNELAASGTVRVANAIATKSPGQDRPSRRYMIGRIR